MISQFRITLNNVHYEIERKEGIILVNGQEFPFTVEGNTVHTAGTQHTIVINGRTATIDGIQYDFDSTGLEEKRQVVRKKAASTSAAEEAGALTAVMPGLILNIMKNEGDTVEKGDVIIILEAMKMQNELTASKSGTIRKITVKKGDSVEMRQILAIIE